jgi:penicillin-binding protein 1A
MADALLTIHLPGEGSRRQALHGGTYRLGRGSDCEICLPHPAVSRQHGLLEQQGSQWLLRDSASTNGLWWRGQRVQELLLNDGDTVRFGPSHQAGVPELLFQRRPQPRLHRALRLTSLGLAAIAATGLATLGLALLQAPIRGSLAPVRGPLALYDREGKPIASAEGKRHRELANLGDYPSVLVDALLASEDSRFWWHPGVDPIGTGRALVTNLVGGRVLEGGSTLTQQLARSLYPDQVGQGETLGRKWRELLVSLQLEARFSKRELLLSYLNRVYLGVGWGFEDASRQYFGKSAAGLELAEAALLVGLLPSPNGYDPCFDPQAALDSRNRVLAKMVDTGRISADAGRRARRSPVQLSPEACREQQRRRGAPFFTDQVRRDLEAQVGAAIAAEGNFLIDTHLHPQLQATVERLLRQRISSSSRRGRDGGGRGGAGRPEWRHFGGRWRPRLRPEPVQPRHDGAEAAGQHLQAASLSGGPGAGGPGHRCRGLRPPRLARPALRQRLRRHPHPGECLCPQQQHRGPAAGPAGGARCGGAEGP